MNRTEEKTKEYFQSSGFQLQRIPESGIKTPDFEGEEILVEVKEVRPKEKQGLQQDSTYNAIKNNLKDAARKFHSYDQLHKKKHIAILFSEDIIKEDIYSVWTGEWSPNHRERIFKGGMVLSGRHREHVDAVVWFKKVIDQKPSYVWLANEDAKKFFPSLEN